VAAAAAEKMKRSGYFSRFVQFDSLVRRCKPRNRLRNYRDAHNVFGIYPYDL